jgi:hypothetical protein
MQSTKTVDKIVHKLFTHGHLASFIAHSSFCTTFNHCGTKKILYKIYGEGIPQVSLRM